MIESGISDGDLADAVIATIPVEPAAVLLENLRQDFRFHSQRDLIQVLANSRYAKAYRTFNDKVRGGHWITIKATHRALCQVGGEWYMGGIV